MAFAFKNGLQKEKHIVDFVMGLVKSSEEQTLPTRQLWVEKEQLFDGIQDWGQDKDGSEWQTRMFTHEYSPMIREAAQQITETVFQSDKFINLTTDDDASREMVRIIEKVVRYYLMNSKEMAFPKKFLAYVIAGCIYGPATFKHTVNRKLYYKPEMIIEEIKKQERKETRGVRAENTSETILSPDGEEIMSGLEDAIEKVFGTPSETQYARPKPGMKQVLEMCMELKLVNPHNFFYDPSAMDMNDSFFHAEKMFPNFHDLIPLFEAGVLDKRKKERLLKLCGQTAYNSSNTGFSNDEFQKLLQRKQFTDHSSPILKCELTEYFGPILSPDGSEILIENAHVIIGNGKLLLKSGTNGYWDQRSPYISAVFNTRPFKSEGTGIADGALNQQKALNEIFSLFLDALKMDVYSPTVVNVDKLQTQEDLDGGIAPGDILRAIGEGRAEDVLSKFPVKSNIAPQIFQTLEFLKLSGQKSSSVNTMSSNPASRARITGTEIQANEGRRNLTINSLGSELDYNCLEPLVTRTLQLALQFGFTVQNLSLMAAKGVLTASEFQYLAGMSDVERYTLAMKQYKIEVRGFRYTMARIEEQRSAAEFMAQVNMLPPQAQQKINFSVYLRDQAERFGLDPDRLIIQNTPQDKAREENSLLILDQMVMILQEDDHLAHLPAHYDALMVNGPVQSLVAHVQQHIQTAMMMGMQVPPPPPEVAQLLGMNQAPQAEGNPTIQ